MVRFKTYLLSESNFRVFLSSQPTGSASRMRVLASFDKKDYKAVYESEYDEDNLIYDILLSNNEIGNIYDAMIKIEFLNSGNDVTDETRWVSAFVKKSVTTSGIVKVIQNDFRVAARLNGSKVFFIKVKKENSPCTECWDEDLRSSNDSGCKVCGGTGYVKYFFSPYKTIAGPILNAAGESKTTDDAGKSSDNVTSSFNTYADFSLAVDDYVYSTITGAVLRVTGTNYSEVQGVQVLATISASEVPSEMPEVEQLTALLEKKFGEFYAK